MASDLAQYHYKDLDQSSATLPAFSGHRLPQNPHYRSFELTRLDAFVDGDEDIFEILARQSQKYNHDSALKEAVDSTITVLRNAQNIIHQQSARIETLEDMRMHDELTGLLNVKGMAMALQREMARAERKGESHNIFITVQLDNLDAIRTQYGAEASDEALKILARALAAQARTTDLVARVARDEFTMLFADAEVEHTIPRIQSLNLGLNKLSFDFDGQDVALLCSLAMKKCDDREAMLALIKPYLLTRTDRF